MPTETIGQDRGYDVSSALGLVSGHHAEDANSLQGLSNRPVVNITWYEARKYNEWRTERLRGWEDTPEPLAAMLRTKGWQVTLTGEVEWEKTARNTDAHIYPWGERTRLESGEILRHNYPYQQRRALAERALIVDTEMFDRHHTVANRSIQRSF